DQARGGVVCYRDCVALLRERPGLPSIGYFAMTEEPTGATKEPGGKLEKVANGGELAECFKIASPREWPGGSPSQYGLTNRSDLEPSETWRRVVREAYLAALKSNDNVLVDAWTLAHAS